MKPTTDTTFYPLAFNHPSGICVLMDSAGQWLISTGPHPAKPCPDSIAMAVIRAVGDHLTRDFVNKNNQAEPVPTEPPPVKSGFIDELTGLINRLSVENGSNTPDFILARFLGSCLEAWNQATNKRDAWQGRITTLVEPPQANPATQGGQPSA